MTDTLPYSAFERCGQRGCALVLTVAAMALASTACVGPFPEPPGRVPDSGTREIADVSSTEDATQPDATQPDATQPDATTTALLDPQRMWLERRPYGTRASPTPSAALISEPGAATAGHTIEVLDEQSNVIATSAPADGSGLVPPIALPSVVTATIAVRANDGAQTGPTQFVLRGRWIVNHPSTSAAAIHSWTSPKSRPTLWQRNGDFGDALSQGDLAALGGPSSLIVATRPSWRERLADATTPRPRSDAAGAYDPVRGRVVLFGGVDGVAAPRNDLWEWDGDTWLERTDAACPGPSARSEHAMAFDSARGATVLFGGRDMNAVPLDDLWTWDGQTWACVGASAADARCQMCGGATQPATWPAGRFGHTLTAHPGRGTVVATGGFTTGGVTNDTREWDGVAWAQLMPIAGPRFRHAAVYLASLNAVLVFGGDDGGVRLDDTQLLSAAGQWTVPTAGAVPNARTRAALFVDPSANRATLSGGVSAGGQLADAHMFDPTSGWAPTSSITTARPGTVAITADSHGTVMFVGGVNALDESYVWDGRTGGLTATRPETRSTHAMAYEPLSETTFLFGGSPHDCMSMLDETWSFNGHVWRRIPTSTRPGGRRSAGLAFDDDNRELVMFGGCAPIGCNPVPTHHCEQSWGLAEVWVWDGTDWRDVSNMQGQRSSPGLTQDGTGLISIAGDTNAGPTTTMLRWDALTRTWADLPIAGPSGRIGDSVAFDPISQEVLQFGGRNGATPHSETWIWNGTSWSQPSLTRPPPRSAHAMAFDRGAGVAVLFGGYTTTDFDDVWSFDFATRTWEDMTADVGPGPPARRDHRLVYDASRGVGVLFGGEAGAQNYKNDTWELDLGVLDRPGLVTSLDWTQAGVGPEAIDTVAVEVVAGGRGGASTALGVDVCLWSPRRDRWDGCQSHGFDVPVARQIARTGASAAELLTFADRTVYALARTASAAATVGRSAETARLVVVGVEFTIEYELP